MKIFDIHQHVCWRGRNAEGLIADMDKQGIEEACLLTWEIPPSEDHHSYHGLLNSCNLRTDGTHAGITLSDLLSAKDRFPERFRLGYCPNPTHPAACDQLQSAFEMHSLAICGEWKYRMLFDDPRNIRLMRTAGELGLPVLLHLDIPWRPSTEGHPSYDPLWFGGTVDNLERCIIECPDTIFIAHAPGFWREISGDANDAPSAYPETPIVEGGRVASLFDEYPNLHADLSANSGLNALKRDPEYALSFLEKYCERILFGRDDYGSQHLDFLSKLELSQETRANIFHRNAEKLLGNE